MSDPVASVIVVNYQGRGKLGATLDAVARMDGIRFETIVVDNASSDDSWDEAQGRDGVRLIRNDDNVGFGRACNQGAAIARGDFLAFLNPDCKPESDWLTQLVAAARADASAGAVQGLILIAETGDVNTAGNRAHYLGFSWAPLHTPATGEKPYEVPTGCGASLLVPAAAFAEVGGFWEELFLYHEDFDLCWRLRLRGYRVLLCPRARSHHAYEFGRNPSKYYDMERGRLLVIGANYTADTLLRLLPALLATELAVSLVAARDGWLGQKLRSLGSVATALPALRLQRRRVQAGRRVRDAAVLAVFDVRLGGEFGAGVACHSARLLGAYASLVGVRAGQNQ